MAKEPKIPIMELFGPTIQGEGVMTGTVTHFLRTGGCGLRCTWCDSLFSVLPAEIKKFRVMMTIPEILARIKDMPRAPYMTFTGGDPCLHKRLGDLIIPLNVLDIRVAVETQGQLFPDWLDNADVVTFSPKGPSSGNIVDIDDMVEWCTNQGTRRNKKVCIKVVVFDEADFQYALDVYRCVPDWSYDAFYFTAGTTMFPTAMYQLPPDDGELEVLAEQRALSVLASQQRVANFVLGATQAVQFNEKVHIGSQQHVLLWPGQDKGV